MIKAYGRARDWALDHPLLQLSCSFTLAACAGLISSLVTR